MSQKILEKSKICFGHNYKTGNWLCYTLCRKGKGGEFIH